MSITKPNSRDLPTYPEAVLLCQEIYDAWLELGDDPCPIIHEAKGHIAHALLRRDERLTLANGRIAVLERELAAKDAELAASTVSWDEERNRALREAARVIAANQLIAAKDAEIGSLHGRIGLFAEKWWMINNNLPTDETFKQMEEQIVEVAQKYIYLMADRDQLSADNLILENNYKVSALEEQRLRAEVAALRTAMKEAQEVLENNPTGGVGSNGATMAELSAAAEAGHVYEGDAHYHTDQHAWLLLDAPRKEDITP